DLAASVRRGPARQCAPGGTAGRAVQQSVGHSAQDNANTRRRRTRTRELAGGCYADGRRGRARRRTTDACANGPWYVRGHDLPVLVTVAPPTPSARGRPLASSR